MPINFPSDPREHSALDAIVARAVSLDLLQGSRLDLTMDIGACHSNGTPLKLDELLKADDFNFAHDVCGIQRHISRKTGELLHCFVPRFAAPERQPIVLELAAESEPPFDGPRSVSIRRVTKRRKATSCAH